MLTALVFIDADVERIPEVAAEIAAINGVSEVYSVTGDIDLVAMVKVREYDDLSNIVADRIGKVVGVQRMRTHLD